MAERKLAKCPTCIPDVAGAVFLKELDSFTDDGKYTYKWVCQNCGHSRPVGKPKLNIEKQQYVLKKIRDAIDSIDSVHPVTVERFEVKDDTGTLYVTIAGRQGTEKDMLGVVSFRMIGIRISPAGGLTVYSDSKYKKQKDLKSVERQFRSGRLWYW